VSVPLERTARRRSGLSGERLPFGFEALEADSVGQVRSIYEALALPDFGHVESALRHYLVRIAGYKKNALSELPAELRTRVAREWRRCFEEWSYPI
jgi:hypothetical protein